MTIYSRDDTSLKNNNSVQSYWSESETIIGDAGGEENLWCPFYNFVSVGLESLISNLMHCPGFDHLWFTIEYCVIPCVELASWAVGRIFYTGKGFMYMQPTYVLLTY